MFGFVPYRASQVSGFTSTPVTSGPILTSASTRISGGEAGDRARESGANMSSNLSGDISEVKFLTVAEVAAVMRVSKMTVYRLVHSGELPAVRVGRSFRVSEQDVNEYLKSSFFQTG
jgi:excisionase family DNA binding protein